MSIPAAPHDLHQLVALLHQACARAEWTIGKDESDAGAITFTLYEPVDLHRVDELMKETRFLRPLHRMHHPGRWCVEALLLMGQRIRTEPFVVDEVGIGLFYYRVPAAVGRAVPPIDRRATGKELMDRLDELEQEE